MNPVSRGFLLAGGIGLIALVGLEPLSARAQGAPHGPPVMVRGFIHHCAPDARGEPARRGEPAAVVTGAPFSAVGKSQTVVTLADGNRITREHTTRHYRDSEGRTRTEHVLSGVGPFTMETPHTIVMIHDPVAGKRYVLHPEMKRVDVVPEGAHFALSHVGPGGHVAMHSGPSSGNMVVAPGSAAAPPDPCGPVAGHRFGPPTPLGEKTINGLRVQGSRMEFQIPAGEMGNEMPITVSTEQWFSPELSIVVASTHRDPLVGETTFRLENIVREEPDPALFTIPSDYEQQEMPPPGPRLHLRRHP